MSINVRLLDREYPDEFHCVPDEDLREHKCGADCWCQPEMEVEEFEDGYFRLLWWHHAADGRDYYQSELIPLQ